MRVEFMLLIEYTCCLSMGLDGDTFEKVHCRFLSKCQNVFKGESKSSILNIKSISIFFQFHLVSHILFVDVESRLVKVWQRNICGTIKEMKRVSFIIRNENSDINNIIPLPDCWYMTFSADPLKMMRMFDVEGMEAAEVGWGEGCWWYLS